jgi:hypothetical protein
VNRRKVTISLLTVFVSLVVYQCAARVMVAKSVLPPHAANDLILRNLVRSPYQMAAPHSNLIKSIMALYRPVTSVCASGITPDCDGTQAKATCNYACGFCGHCPDCVNGPCTIYTCQQTTNLRYLCQLANGTGSCVGCEADINIGCHRPGT